MAFNRLQASVQLPGFSFLLFFVLVNTFWMPMAIRRVCSLVCPGFWVALAIFNASSLVSAETAGFFVVLAISQLELPGNGFVEAESPGLIVRQSVRVIL